MPSDSHITPKHVLDAIHQLDRTTPDSIFSELESMEPELAEYLLESTTTIHQKVIASALVTAAATQLQRVSLANLGRVINGITD